MNQTTMPGSCGAYWRGAYNLQSISTTRKSGMVRETTIASYVNGGGDYATKPH